MTFEVIENAVLGDIQKNFLGTFGVRKIVSVVPSTTMQFVVSNPHSSEPRLVVPQNVIVAPKGAPPVKTMEQQQSGHKVQSSALVEIFSGCVRIEF